MNLKKTNFFILGAPKCGTTSMYHWLKQHSEIYFPEIKETHFFSTDLHQNKRSIKKMEDYKYLYSDARNNHKVLGDASVFYLYSEEAVPNILEYNSEAKFLVMLRNPVEMVVSLHAQYLHTGNEIFEDFEKAWNLKDERINGVCTTKITEDPQLLNYGEVCSLGYQVERLLKKVDKDKVKFILLEDLKKKPEKILTDLFQFLEIKNEKIDLEIKNKATARRSKKFHRFLKYLNRYKKDIGIGRLNTSIGKLTSRLNTKKGSKFVLEGDFRKEVINKFESDVELLMKLLNEDLTHWLK